MNRQKRILAIGEVEALAEIRRVLRRAEFEMHRVPAAQAAVPMVRRFPFDLMIVIHPLVDTEFDGFYRQVRAPEGPCRNSQLLVLTRTSRLAELDAYHRDPLLEVVDRAQPMHRLEEAAARYLGPIRTAPREKVSWPAVWPSSGPLETVDLSANGARLLLEAGELPPLGEPGELVLSPPEPEQPIRLAAEVTRRIEASPGRGFAVAWTGADDDGLERLERLLGELGGSGR